MEDSGKLLLTVTLVQEPHFLWRGNLANWMFLCWFKVKTGTCTVSVVGVDVGKTCIKLIVFRHLESDFPLQELVWNPQTFSGTQEVQSCFSLSAHRVRKSSRRILHGKEILQELGTLKHKHLSTPRLY